MSSSQILLGWDLFWSWPLSFKVYKPFGLLIIRLIKGNDQNKALGEFLC